MEQQLLSIEEFNVLLQQWSGHPIKITKEELRDYDETHLELESVSYNRDTRRLDNYESINTLLLNGKGQVQTETRNQDFAALPDYAYEIPLEDSTQYKFDGDCFFIKTERGTYTIEAMPFKE